MPLTKLIDSLHTSEHRQLARRCQAHRMSQRKRCRGFNCRVKAPTRTNQFT